MAPLPALPDPLPASTGSLAAHLTVARSHADGSAHLPAVYAALLHHPALARSVAALGEQIRFQGVLPDDVRELVVLRYSARFGYDYEWAHHQRPAALAGIRPETLALLGAATGPQFQSGPDGTTDPLVIPAGLRSDQQAAIRATDAVCEGEEIPADVQDLLIAAHGVAGVVELVVTCGLYAIMGYTVRSFDVQLEDRLQS